MEVKGQMRRDSSVPERSRIFISYRHKGGDEYAVRALVDELHKHFPRNQVFHDITSIEPGADFHRALHRGLDSCAAVLVVIGPTWLTVVDDKGRRRLDSPDDWVRTEVAESLRRPDVRVFPLLLNAQMPSAQDLPEPLQPLTRRQAFSLTERYWSNDVAQLITFLKQVPEIAAIATGGTSVTSRLLVGGIALGLVLFVFAVTWYVKHIAPLLGRWDDIIMTEGNETHARYLDVSWQGLEIKIEPTGQRPDPRFEATSCGHQSFDGDEWKFICSFADNTNGFFKFSKLSDELFQGTLTISDSESDVKQRLRRVPVTSAQR
jgi:hypothetical protein